MNNKLSYDDVLIEPNYSEIRSRSDITDLSCNLTKRIKLNIPVVASPMDSVSGNSELAIELAKIGGVSIIHRFMSIEDQTNIIKKVKRKRNLIIRKPEVVHEYNTIEFLKEKANNTGFSSFPVLDFNNFLVGIITRKDYITADNDKKVCNYMTNHINKSLVYLENKDFNINKAKDLIAKHKIEKILLVEKNSPDGLILSGMVTYKDILAIENEKTAILDSNGRYLVGGAIGVVGDYKERAYNLGMAGVDFLCIDVAHGHHVLVKECLEYIKNKYDIDVLAGSIATGQAAVDLENWGADGLRCNVGSGSICTTRLISGVGVPSFSCIQSCANIAQIPICADGGIRTSGDAVKAFAAGADTIMLGKLLAGCEESSSIPRIKNGKKIKTYRGMASFDVNLNRKDKNLDENYMPEGVESEVPYSGKLSNVIGQFLNGIRSGMSYLGCRKLDEISQKAKVIQITQAGRIESMPHIFLE